MSYEKGTISERDNILPVSVVIPTLSRPKTLKRTIESFLLGDYLPSQIIIVDQTTDESERKEIKEVVQHINTVTSGIYIYQSTPSSSLARNTGIKKVINDIIIFSDDDVDVYNDTLSNIYHVMKDEDIVLVAGLNDCSAKSNRWISYILGTKSFLHRHIGHVTKSMLGRFPDNCKVECDTMWAMGFFFCTRKSFIDKYGILFDEKLSGYAYGEDLDFTFGIYKRAKMENKKCKIFPQVHVKHLASLEYRTPTEKHTYMYVINRMYLTYKHHMGVSGRLAVMWCDIWKLLFRMVNRDDPKSMKVAYRWFFRNRKSIESGKISYPSL